MWALFRSSGEDQWHQAAQGSVPRTPSQRHLRTLFEEREARMPRSPGALSGEAARAACEIAYVVYFNQARPHQGMAQQVASRSGSATSSHQTSDKVIALPVMGGLHHDYHWVA